jgi:hypothetical protein
MMLFIQYFWAFLDAASAAQSTVQHELFISLTNQATEQPGEIFSKTIPDDVHLKIVNVPGGASFLGCMLGYHGTQSTPWRESCCVGHAWGKHSLLLEQLRHLQHVLDAVMYACRRQAEKQKRSRLLL